MRKAVSTRWVWKVSKKKRVIFRNCADLTARSEIEFYFIAFVTIHQTSPIPKEYLWYWIVVANVRDQTCARSEE